MNTKWLTTKQLGFYHGGLAAVNYFNERIGERRGDYPCLTNKHDKLISEINTNGYAKLEGVFTKQQIEALGQDFDTAQASGLVSQDNEFFTMIQDPLLPRLTSGTWISDHKTCLHCSPPQMLVVHRARQHRSGR